MVTIIWPRVWDVNVVCNANAQINRLRRPTSRGYVVVVSALAVAPGRRGQARVERRWSDKMTNKRDELDEFAEAVEAGQVEVEAGGRFGRPDDPGKPDDVPRRPREPAPRRRAHASLT